MIAVRLVVARPWALIPWPYSLEHLMNIETIDLQCLRAHPMNSNVMREDLLDKLAGHIERTGRYPPLIVREIEEDSPMGEPSPQPSASGRGGKTYQVLDGHHRWAALQRLGHESASCVVWEVDDAGALLLLSTLNRLQGQDDPHRRSRLLAELSSRMNRKTGELAKLLPESGPQLKKYLTLREPPPKPQAPPSLDDMPTAVTFFLTGRQKHQLDERLKAIGGSREQALMQLAGIAVSDQPSAISPGRSDNDISSADC